MRDNFSFVLGVGGVVVGLIGIGYALGARKKLNDICDRIDQSLDNLSDNMAVDIPQSMIDRAVEKAVDREVERQVGKAADRAVKEVTSDIRSEIKKSVNSSYSDVKTSVTDELKRQVGRVDIAEVKRDVINEAKDTAAKQFQDSLDDILEKFNNDLNNISLIYKSIANAITKDGSNKDITLKLT